jgi:predicted DNA-binding transcriptional regulator YafY
MTARLGSGASAVDPELLVTLTRACRDGERLRVRYRDLRGRETDRRVDPHRLVSTARRWYLVARDVDRADWRSFRVDRLLAVEATGHRVAVEDPPDPVAFVQAAITTRAYRYQARVELIAPVDDVAALVPPNTGILEPIDERRTMLTTGGDDLDVIVFHLLTLGVAMVIHEPPALRRHVAAAARRLAAAVR